MSIEMADDITASSPTTPTIREFYAGRSILVTGSTGFLGKVLVEKFLRACPRLARIYVLIRPKDGKDAKQRLAQILAEKLFDRVRQATPGVEEKVVAISGDITEPNLGVAASDEEALQREVSIVFHSAATVRFDDHLRIAILLNVVGVQNVITMCRKLPKIEALVHVSTAYANCDRKEIEECVYPPAMCPQTLIDAVQWMDDDMCDAVTSHLLGSRPNTYTYTKALAEHLVAEGRGDIPTAIIRPSIIGAAWREPMPGWIDNYNGPTGIFVGIGKGLLRYMMGSMAATADIIPVDIPVNMMIAIAWQTAVTRPERVHVFNCTSGRTNPVSWGEIETMIVKSVTKNPIDKVFRVPSARFTASPLWYRLVVIFDHYLPAYIFDLVTKFIGGKPILMRIYDKIHRSLATLDYFTSNNWDFASENSLMLTSAMTEEDLKEFNFSMNGLRWQSYLDTYVLGTKQFVLKEDLAGLPLARRHLLKLQIFQYLMQVVLFCVVWRLLVARTNIARKLWRFVISLSQKFVVRLPRVTRSS